MTVSFFRKFLSVFLICLTASNLFAWGITGHRVIAEIAENHLTSKSKRHLKKIIGNQKLAYWANWPDFIKSDTTGVYKHTEQWHYVNINPQKNFKDFSDSLKVQKSPNLYTQIIALSQKIKDKNTPALEREQDLRFLIHLMGDLSQPMHVGRSKDLGGNLIQIQYFKEGTNLHALWDSKLVDNQKYSYTEYAGVLDIKNSIEVKDIQAGTLEEWLYDSHVIANKLYANTVIGKNYSYDYMYKYNAILERQLLYGGLRLAKVLNDIL